jgi:hypothetical protein
VPQQGPSALEQSLGAFPQALQQVGVTLTQAEALRQHQQRAQDTLDGKVQLQDYRQALQQRYSELQEGDYRTLAKDTMAEGKRLIAEMGMHLTPQARALFTEDAEQVLSTVQQHALGEYSRRRDEHAKYAFARELQQFQEAYARARTPYDREVLQGQLDDFMQQGAASGLFPGQALAEAQKKMGESVAVQDWETLIQADPDRAARNLRITARIATGMAGPEEQPDPGLPEVPPDQLPRLSQLATEVSWGRLQRGWALERDAERRFDQGRQAVEANIIARLSTLDPIPENVRALDGLLAEVNRNAQGDHPVIRPEAQMPLLHAIQSVKAAALKPREGDDEGTARTLTLRIDAADNAQQLEETRLAVFQAAPLLKPSTVRTMLTSLRERKEASHYSNIKGFRDGMAILLGADTNEAAYFAWMRQAGDAETEERQRRAIDLFRATMQRLVRESPAQANAEATRIATEIRDTYILKPQRETSLKQLVQQAPTLAGPTGRGILDPDGARQAISQLPYLPDEERQRLFDQWQAWQRLQQQAVPAAPPPAAPSLWQRMWPQSRSTAPGMPTPVPPPPPAGQSESGTRPVRRVPITP